VDALDVLLETRTRLPLVPRFLRSLALAFTAGACLLMAAAVVLGGGAALGHALPGPLSFVLYLYVSAMAFLVAAQLDVSCARPRAALRAERQRPGELGAVAEGGAQPLEVARAKRDRSSARDSVRRVGETDEAFTPLRREQLHDAGESAVAGALRQRQLLEDVRRAPGRFRFSHLPDRSPSRRTRLCRPRARTVTWTN
jgi:hypothetical protein